MVTNMLKLALFRNEMEEQKKNSARTQRERGLRQQADIGFAKERSWEGRARYEAGGEAGFLHNSGWERVIAAGYQHSPLIFDQTVYARLNPRG